MFTPVFPPRACGFMSLWGKGGVNIWGVGRCVQTIDLAIVEGRRISSRLHWMLSNWVFAVFDNVKCTILRYKIPWPWNPATQGHFKWHHSASSSNYDSILHRFWHKWFRKILQSCNPVQRSLKVTEICTIRYPACGFLLVSHGNYL